MSTAANAAGKRVRSSSASMRRTGQSGLDKGVTGTPEANVIPPPVLRRFRRQYRWEHTELEPYKVSTHAGGEFAGASRQVLVGKRGERVAFHLRYFELHAGGYTSLERHRHSHVIVGVRGRGLVRVGEEKYTLKPLDAIYIGPEQAHQLRATGRSRFGFFCIVDSRRDRPRPVEPERVERTVKTSKGAFSKLKRHGPHAGAGN
ncbi:MAG TPA: cupin domain-containing protein [Candidatus Binataceae bacterium]